jgi:transcription initiation factor TFIIIB Brf1 subunit/transcription initiation factor TFIIB
MSNEFSACEHLNLTDDYHEGTVVCLSCGLVISPLFINQLSSVKQLQFQEDISTEISNLLDRIHIPICYSNQILSYFNKNFTTKSKHALIFSSYKVLNDLDIPISIKEISNVSSVSKKNINKVQQNNSFVHFNSNTTVEKYSKILNLCYKTTTLIKKRVASVPVSGHNPNSVIASVIYQVCKEQKIKASIKKIAEVTSVSCISIQRYNNYSKQ